MIKILLLNGPNLNLLGVRETELYGGLTLLDISTFLVKEAFSRNILLQIVQSNSESRLIGALHDAMLTGIGAVIVNPASYTHSSVGIRDALLSLGAPFIEVHLTNLKQREPFRHYSFMTEISAGIISGLGWQSYWFALQSLAENLL